MNERHTDSRSFGKEKGPGSNKEEMIIQFDDNYFHECAARPSVSHTTFLAEFYTHFTTLLQQQQSSMAIFELQSGGITYKNDFV